MMRFSGNKAVCLADALKDLDFATIGPGYRRGLVLASWKAKVCEVTGQKKWHRQLDTAWLTGQQAPSDSPAYCHPELVIKMKPGSMWIPELHMQRYAIKKAINERFEQEFIRNVRVK